MKNFNPEDIVYLHLAETDSTNAEVKRQAAAAAPYLVVSTDYQTAGRGQKGSSWESEKGKNLLFSVMFRPDGISADRQFRLSQCMALAVTQALLPFRGDKRGAFSIKWPNDIYYKEKKLSGTIIETTLRGSMVERCIIGVGVNINQRDFLSDAPNPVSLCQIVRHEVDKDIILSQVMDNFISNLHLLKTDEDCLASRYTDNLIWRHGLHRYCDTAGEFDAELVDVAPDGCLTLRDTDGRNRSYYFKEVRHVFKI